MVQSPGVSIVAGQRVDLPACNGPIARLGPSHERQVRPDNFISASNSCQKIWQNRFYFIGKQKEMKKKRHSGIFQAFWPVKVEAKSAKHVINITSEATSKKMCKASQLKSMGTGTVCEY